MSKGLKIALITVVVILIVAVAGFFVLGNRGGKSVGIDDSITNVTDKPGSTELNSEKVLVVYFSHSGNKQKLAKLISDKVGGAFVRIETVQTYPSEYSELVDFAKKERDENIKPELKDLGINVDDYDTVFIGYPIWWYQMPMPMYTFFDAYNFDGKTIIPFNTHEGSGDGGTYDDIKELEPNATVLEGLAVRGGDMSTDQNETVDSWLNELSLNK